MEWLLLLLGLIVGLVLGFMSALIRGRRTEKELKNENEALKIKAIEQQKELEVSAEKNQWLSSAEKQLRDTFEALGSQVLRDNANTFLDRAREQLNTLLTGVRGDWKTHKEELMNLVEPLGKTLKTMDEEVRKLEEKRAGAYESLKSHLGDLVKAQSELHDTTIDLTRALKSPTIRGRWGEFQLRRVVELAGMLQHVDFVEQYQTGEGVPDMVVRLPNQGSLPVDSKAPMDAYFAAHETTNEQERKDLLEKHKTSIRKHIRDLDRKQYWKQVDHAPELVIMFVGNEACLSTAFELDPTLLEFALAHRVLIAAPLTMLSLLRAVAYGWQQYEISESANEMVKSGVELYTRLCTFVDHFQDAGKGLRLAVQKYNAAVGSLHHRVFPMARKLEVAAGKELPQISAIEEQVRAISRETNAE